MLYFGKRRNELKWDSLCLSDCFLSHFSVSFASFYIQSVVIKKYNKKVCTDFFVYRIRFWFHRNAYNSFIFDVPFGFNSATHFSFLRLLPWSILLCVQSPLAETTRKSVYVFVVTFVQSREQVTRHGSKLMVVVDKQWKKTEKIYRRWQMETQMW